VSDVDCTQELPTVLSLCTGYGGIERGLELAGFEHRTVAHVEIEAFAAANLVAKMEAGQLVSAPVWTDLKTLPAHCFRDRVDVLTGGYPCQPFSAAGLRKGVEDPRHLWPYIYDHIRTIRPVRCFFENVEGHISLGLRQVIDDLERLGYQTTWGIFSASEVGAPHQRKRVYILAYADGAGLETQWTKSVEKWQTRPIGQSGAMANTDSQRQRVYILGDANCDGRETNTRGRSLSNKEWNGEGEEQRRNHQPAGVDRAGDVADATGNDARTIIRDLEGEDGKKNRPQVEEQKDSRQFGDCGSDVADASSQGSQGRVSGGQDQERQGQQGHARRGSTAHGQPEPVSWATEPNVGRVVNGAAFRVDRLRLLGNGVVPHTAAKAWIVLNDQLAKENHG
jgi:DNA (cytosine-5)-methyltransferase 1